MTSKHAFISTLTAHSAVIALLEHRHGKVMLLPAGRSSRDLAWRRAEKLEAEGKHTILGLYDSSVADPHYLLMQDVEHVLDQREHATALEGPGMLSATAAVAAGATA